jgi:hypothetical protein
MSVAEQRARNQQTNFETILQIVNLRSQPENITDSVCEIVKTADLQNSKFGGEYLKKTAKQKTVNIWSFAFSVEHPSVFDNGLDQLGNLLSDCEQVPMIVNLNESVELPAQLNITDQLRNIYFEIL